MTLRASYGAGRYVATEHDVYVAPLESFAAGGLRGLVYCHGADATPTALRDYTLASGERPLIDALAASHQVIAGELGGVRTWGNDTAISRVGSARTYLQGTRAAMPGKVVLVGLSMGGLSALNFARANPTLVQAVALIIPALDLNDIVATNYGGMAASVNTAYGGAYNSGTHGPTHSPLAYASAVTLPMPIAIWSSSDDTLTQNTIAPFLAAVPHATHTSVGALGHTQTAIAAATAALASWVEAND